MTFNLTRWLAAALTALFIVGGLNACSENMDTPKDKEDQEEGGSTY